MRLCLNALPEHRNLATGGSVPGFLNGWRWMNVQHILSRFKNISVVLSIWSLRDDYRIKMQFARLCCLPKER